MYICTSKSIEKKEENNLKRKSQERKCKGINETEK